LAKSRVQILVKIDQRSGHTGTQSIDKKHHNSLQGGPINFILGGWNKDQLPNSGAQTGCHDNDGCLATGPRNLHFMIEYIKIARV